MRLAFLALLVVSAFASGLAQRAEAFVYWTNLTSTTLGRAESDGANPNQNFITGANKPCGVAVDGAHIYWANRSPDSIGRANLNGTGANPTFITGAFAPCGVAVDGAHIYWANTHLPSGGDSIGRADLNGAPASVDQNFITGLDGPCGVAVDSTHIYWANNGATSVGLTIGRADLDGSPVDNSFITGTNSPCGVAVNAAHIFWANTGGNVGRADLSGDPLSVDQSFITSSNACGLALDSGHIYWGSLGVANRIARADLGGDPTSIDESFVTGSHSPCGVAVNGLTSPVCQDASATTGYAQAIGLSLSCTSGGGTRSFSIASRPAHGQISGFNPSAGTLTYTPSVGFNGSDSFTFKAANVGAGSKVATATISVGKASNLFTVTKVKKNKHRGTAKVNVEVPGDGLLAISSPKIVLTQTVVENHIGQIRVKPDRKLRRRLDRTGKAKVSVELTYTPTGGDPATRSLSIALREVD
jgi:virginiamycin B lyase